MTSQGAAYSGTPLARKLGFKEGAHVVAENAPADYIQWLHPMPSCVVFEKTVSQATDLIHLFVVHRSLLKRHLMRLRTRIRPNAAVWVSWPKKSSKTPTDITGDVIRELALPIGFVDVKVCAVNDVWSGLKLYIRKELR